MRGARVFPGLFAVALVGVGFVACGGKVDVESEDSGADAVIDSATETAPTPTPTPTTTVTPPSCPTYRPIRSTPCSIGLSCFFPCDSTSRTSIRATCPSGNWVLTDVEMCP